MAKIYDILVGVAFVLVAVIGWSVFGHASTLSTVAEAAVDLEIAKRFSCSGFVVGPPMERLIVTADHCVWPITHKLVENKILADGHPAGIVAVDETWDLAILRFKDWTPVRGLTLDSTPLEYGQQVYSVSNAESQGDVIGVGLFSGSMRVIWGEEFVQYEQVILGITSFGGMCQGSSGGAVINTEGAVVGVVVAGDDAPCGSLAFAVPAARVEALLEEAFNARKAH